MSARCSCGKEITWEVNRYTNPRAASTAPGRGFCMTPKCRRGRAQSFQMLRMCNVTKDINGFPVLQDVSLEVRCGQVVGLLGSNGAGKTTIIRILLGLASQDSGEAWINGCTFKELDEPLRSVGAVIDSTTLDPRLSARDNLQVYASAYRIPTSRIDNVLQLVGLANVKKKRVKDYSLGMKKRLAIAAGLLTDPKFLVLDEPSNGLDPEGLRWLTQLLVRLTREYGKGILLSSHMLAEFEDVLDTVVILDRGQVRYSGSVEYLRGAGLTRAFVDDGKELAKTLSNAGLEVLTMSQRSVELDGDVRTEVGRIALASAIPLQGLEFERDSLSAAYFQIIQGEKLMVCPNKQDD